MKLLHWTTLPVPQVPSTIWNQLDDETEAAHIDVQKLQQLFSLKGDVSRANNANSNANSAIDSAARMASAQLLDVKRSNIIGILLARMRLPIPKIIQAILEGDDNTLPAESLDGLLKAAPTAAEVALVRSYVDNPNLLGTPERFVLAFANVELALERIEAMLFRLRFVSATEDLRKGLDTLSQACDDVRDPRLSTILQAVLALGNFMNGSTAKGCAWGFKLDTLAKLQELKSVDRRTTLLHYLCAWISSIHPEVMEFVHGEGALASAPQVIWRDVISDLNSMAQRTTSLEHLLQSLQPSDPFRIKLSQFHEIAAQTVSVLLDQRTKLEARLRQTTEFFGEDRTTQAEDFFAKIQDFRTALQKAWRDNLREKLVVRAPSSHNNKTTSSATTTTTTLTKTASAVPSSPPSSARDRDRILPGSPPSSARIPNKALSPESSYDTSSEASATPTHSTTTTPQVRLSTTLKPQSGTRLVRSLFGTLERGCAFENRNRELADLDE
eukprot:gnl/Spiro4/27052_TR13457_c0_g1_i1.p1 gnl/Spiro4/27052_TR13457_c0_g1~~gnl/Spiro4/27052_TR13457_c0_g1_i1.p1  ORF type:complete len:530 (-),score=70.26 gnl/Spiro4/27052_TR13457_c0_g1_i1:6-1499(-)